MKPSGSPSGLWRRVMETRALNSLPFLRTRRRLAGPLADPPDFVEDRLRPSGLYVVRMMQQEGALADNVFGLVAVNQAGAFIPRQHLAIGDPWLQSNTRSILPGFDPRKATRSPTPVSKALGEIAPFCILKRLQKSDCELRQIH